MQKQIIANYSFNVGNKQITLSDFSSTQIVLERLFLIVDVTTNKILYNFADATVAQASIIGDNVIQLNELQGGEEPTDKLQITYGVLGADPTYVP